jgi:outer membrane protein OmpA-like peptidoglycan-associated protein
MFRSLASLLVVLGAFCAATQVASAQSAVDAGGTVGLIFPSEDISFAVQDLKFDIEDVAGKTQGMAGQTQTLQVSETPTEIRIELSADVLFDFDKSVIRPDAASALHGVAEIIKDKGKGRDVRIEGHTDGKGADAYNQKLSERRADSVKQWLVEREGLGQVKIATRGFGAKKPVAPNTKPDGSDDPAGRQKNRRVEIVLAK